ncbi:hypothetical protein SNEBB_000845 [Seison nebaliae]|nr:hypothetical protein SNEBB_000845 [Seison nebaliae]
MFENFDWKEFLFRLIIKAGENPWEFIVSLLLLLTPFFIISAYLSYRMLKQLKQEKKVKDKANFRKKAIQQAMEKAQHKNENKKRL